MDSKALQSRPHKSPIQLKEKFVAVMESVFRGEDPSQGRGDQFWDELLVLKVNGASIGRCVGSASEEVLLKQGSATLRLLAACSRVIAEKDAMRCCNALVIVGFFFRAVFRKKFSNFGFDVLNLVAGGFELGDSWFRGLVDGVLSCVREPRPAEQHAAAVELLLVLASGCENVAANSLIEYLHREDAFEALMLQFPRHADVSQPSVFCAFLVVVLIANYQKYEMRNLFVSRLAALDNPDVMASVALVSSEVLAHVRASIRLPDAVTVTATSNGAGRKLSGSGDKSAWTLFAASSGAAQGAAAVAGVGELLQRFQLGGVLLALYEMCYLTKDFFMRSLLSAHGVSYGDKQLGRDVVPKGTDLLRELLETASSLCLAVKDERSALHCKMALLAFVPWLEDAPTLDVLHSTRLSWPGGLRLARKTDNSGIVGSTTESDVPPICWVLDVLLEFVKNNIHVQLQIRLHLLVMSLFHRVLCYQKTHHVCLKKFRWDALWKQMFRLIAFVAKDEWFKKPEVAELVLVCCTIFNLFITYGDTFLPSGNDYDFLYYELIREAKTLQTVQLLVDKYAADTPLSMHMENISAIVAHFKQRIEQWSKANDNQAISPDDVLLVIKRNYGSLKLTLLDNLDVFQLYSENPSQISFFRQYIRLFVADTRALVTATL